MSRHVRDSTRSRDGAHQSPGTEEAPQVLVVEADTSYAEELSQALRRNGYLPDTVSTGTEALQALGGADIVLLDLDLPDLDGLEVCRRIRLTGSVPIISSATRGAELDYVLGLNAGADDHVVKPCGLRELLARMEAVLRRVRPRPTAKIITHGGLTIDTGLRELLLDGHQVALTPKEFDLLCSLASQPGTTLSRRQLLSQVWDDDWSHPGRTIDTHVSSLRSKLGSRDWIVTVRGVGFRIGHA